jgi:hypothetical protein
VRFAVGVEENRLNTVTSSGSSSGSDDEGGGVLSAAEIAASKVKG